MAHQWQESVLHPAFIDDFGVKHPAAYWFPKCSVCGCTIAPQRSMYVATLRAIYLIEQHCHWTSNGSPTMESGWLLRSFVVLLPTLQVGMR
jgi:hypothetical protein